MKRAGRDLWLPLGAVVTALAVGFALIRMAELQRREQLVDATRDAAVTQARRLEAELARALSSLELLAAAAARDARGSPALARPMLETAKPLIGFAIVEDGAIRQSWPTGLFDDLDLEPDAPLGSALALARDRSGAALAGPTTLVNGSVALQAAVDTGAFAVLGAVELGALLHSSEIDELGPRYRYELTCTRAGSVRPVVLARSTELTLDRPVEDGFEIAGSRWTLSMAPRAGWDDPSRVAAQLVLVVVASLVLGYSTRRLLSEPERLRREAEIRRRRLSNAQRELEAEVKQREEVQQRLQHGRTHDTLTGLSNRVSFTAQVEAALGVVRRKDDLSIAVLFIDVDRFKNVNDSFGNAAGDDLLGLIAGRLREGLRPSDILARLGGDEFAILLPDLPDASAARALAGRLVELMREPFQVEEQTIFLTASIGIALSDEGYENAEDMLRDAGTAGYRAKLEGRDRYLVFDQAMRQRAVSMIKIEAELRRAIERDELRVFLQPIVTLETRQLAGFEALVRWIHPERGFMPPVEFIPVAEETGVVIWIDRWVLGAATRCLKSWRDRYPAAADLFVSVNLSGRQLAQPSLVEHVAEIVEDAGLAFDHLKLEITESVVVGNPDAAAEVLRELAARGIRLAVDDFGTGYSSLSYLERFPFHTVKVDQSFVRGMEKGGRGGEIVRTIVELAHRLEMDTIAEGIETDELVSRLQDMRCELGQGYHFSKPLPVEDAERLVANGARFGTAAS